MESPREWKKLDLSKILFVGELLLRFSVNECVLRPVVAQSLVIFATPKTWSYSTQKPMGLFMWWT